MLNPDNSTIKFTPRKDDFSTPSSTKPSGTPNTGKDFKKIMGKHDKRSTQNNKNQVEDDEGDEEVSESQNQANQPRVATRTAGVSLFDLSKKEKEKLAGQSFKQPADKPSQSIAGGVAPKSAPHKKGPSSEQSREPIAYNAKPMRNISEESSSKESDELSDFPEESVETPDEKIETPELPHKKNVSGGEQQESHLVKEDAPQSPTSQFKELSSSKDKKLVAKEQPKGSEVDRSERVHIKEKDKKLAIKEVRQRSSSESDQSNLSYMPNAQQTTTASAQLNLNAEQARPSLSPAIKELIDQMIDKVYTLQTTGQTDTTVVLKHPPIFSGANLILTSFDSAKGEFNIRFENLSQAAQQLITAQQSSLVDAMKDKGFVVHMVTATTQIESPIVMQESQPDRGDQQGQQEGQRQGQQQEEEEA